jgi:aspartate/methionine/tyrosine aminotransferase
MERGVCPFFFTFQETAGTMDFYRMAIEAESPEERGYHNIRYNLAESSVADRRLADLHVSVDHVLLAYSDHRGFPPLREAIASFSGCTPTDVATAPGAAAALFLVAAALLDKGDRIAVMHPNYMTNVVTPRILGCHLDYIRIEPGYSFITARQVIDAIQPGTRLVSITLPHNPTGAMMTANELLSLVAFCADNSLLLLVDETYRDLSFGAVLPAAAGLGNHVISVSGLSKAYGIPGLRMGWACTTNTDIQHRLLAAKEQVFITGSVLDEEIACQVLASRHNWLMNLHSDLRRKVALTDNLINESGTLRWSAPLGGAVGLVEIRDAGQYNLDQFYRVLYEDFGTYVGPGHWFEIPDHFFRLGFGYPDTEALTNGIRSITEALALSRL